MSQSFVPKEGLILCWKDAYFIGEPIGFGVQWDLAIGQICIWVGIKKIKNAGNFFVPPFGRLTGKSVRGQRIKQLLDATETAIAVPLRWTEPNAIGGPQEVRDVDPRTAPKHFGFPLTTIPTRRPFPHISRHVIQAITVRLFLPYRMCSKAYINPITNR